MPLKKNTIQSLEVWRKCLQHMAKKKLLKYDWIYKLFRGKKPNNQIKMGKKHEYVFLEKYRWSINIWQPS